VRVGVASERLINERIWRGLSAELGDRADGFALGRRYLVAKPDAHGQLVLQVKDVPPAALGSQGLIGVSERPRQMSLPACTPD
jgi:hypothetical protein